MARSKYRNGPENEFVQMMRRWGHEPYKRGWPDFWWVKDGRLMCAEVKPHGNRQLKREQRRAMDALTACGVRCFFWSPDEGFREHGTRRDEVVNETPWWRRVMAGYLVRFVRNARACVFN